MNSISFRTIRMGHPNPTIEFFWPVGKEVPHDVRRLTVSEFHLAVQLAAKCIRDMRDVRDVRDGSEETDYKLKYESLVMNLHSLFNQEDKLKELAEEVASLKDMIRAKEEVQVKEPEAVPEPVPALEPEAVPAPEAEASPKPKPKRGRPRKL
jgi:hypothetical protein